MGFKGVKYLESQKLSDAAIKLENCIKDYNGIISKISLSTFNLLEIWHGEGRKEFEKDYDTICRQLTDISEIMYDLHDSLIDSDSAYMLSDNEIAKGLSMAMGEE